MEKKRESFIPLGHGWPLEEKRMLEKVKTGYGKIAALFLIGLVAVQDAWAALELPATTQSDLEGIINDNFPAIIGVIVLLVGAGILIRLIKKAGS